jgi:uncharacterized protein (TIGR04442 family)
MIQDIRLHGQINDKVEYFATIAGRDITNRYFHEMGESGGKPFVRFFSSGNELRITSDGIIHNANGGSFCEYMFGIDLPIKDLVKKDVLNRLVMYGAVYSHESERISFTNNLNGEDLFDHVFRVGNAVSNYYFFIHSEDKVEPKKRQEAILRAIGKYLKHTDKVGKSDDAALVRDLYLVLREEKSIIFLVRIVHRYHEDYHRAFKELYTKNRTVDEEGMSKLAAMAQLYELDLYQAERIRIDVMYKHPENQRIVDEYKGILIECAGKNEIDHLDMARLTRLRTLSIRNRIPLNLFDTLDELLLKGKKIKEVDEPQYIREMRAIFEGLFLQEHSAQVNQEDLIKLLNAKHQAIEHRNNLFEEILLETCRQSDERSIETDDMTILENFGYIITYFDRFDTTFASVNQIAFTEDAEVNEEKIRSLIGNKKAFDEVDKGLFYGLFIESALKNKYLTSYGRRKVNAIHKGVLEVEAGDMSIKELVEKLNVVILEERHYIAVHLYVKERIKSFYSDLSDKDSQDQFISDVWKEMLEARLISGKAPETVFREAIINIRTEGFYLQSLLPIIIAGTNSKLREDFLDNSGLDRFYVEDLERDYFEKNKLNKSLLDRIRKD